MSINVGGTEGCNITARRIDQSILSQDCEGHCNAALPSLIGQPRGAPLPIQLTERAYVRVHRASPASSTTMQSFRTWTARGPARAPRCTTATGRGPAARAALSTRSVRPRTPSSGSAAARGCPSRTTRIRRRAWRATRVPARPAGGRAARWDAEGCVGDWEGIATPSLPLQISALL